MLVVLMFHQIYQENDKSRLNKFFDYILKLKKECNFVNPFDKLKKKINICLSFDDAYYDFYKYVYPFLLKHNIPATLGVPTNYITDVDCSPEERLSVNYPDGLSQTKALCNWDEIKKISESALFNIASHSHTHCDLTTKCNLEFETIKSKEILKEKLNIIPNTFIYPFGKMNQSVQDFISKVYPCVMRIGNGMNFEWTPLMYRVDADDFWLRNKKLSTFNLYLKYFWNRIRNK